MSSHSSRKIFKNTCFPIIPNHLPPHRRSEPPLRRSPHLSGPANFKSARTSFASLRAIRILGKDISKYAKPCTTPRR
jgi:hypothetical protein